MAWDLDMDGGYENGRSTLGRKGTSQGVADAVSALIDALKAKYGFDWALTVMGNGHLIAASNKRDGNVPPKVTP